MSMWPSRFRSAAVALSYGLTNSGFLVNRTLRSARWPAAVAAAATTQIAMSALQALEGPRLAVRSDDKSIRRLFNSKSQFHRQLHLTRIADARSQEPVEIEQ